MAGAINANVDIMFDDSPIDVSTEVNFIWSIANKLRGPYRSDKYKDVIIPMTIIRRTVQYGLAHYPTLDREGHYARCMEHLQQKYAEGGYLQLWIEESENARRLEALREVIRDPELIRKAFDKAFDAETAKTPLPEPEKR